MKPIYLLGYMGCGKTTLGRALAKELGAQFIDLDFYIEQRFRRKVSELFAERGEEGFRRLEANMLRETEGLENVVVSCGGGTPCYYDNMAFIKQNGFSIWLFAGMECTLRRLQMGRNRRPLVEGKSEDELREFIGRHLAEREPYYSQADLKFDGEELEDRRQIAATVSRLLPLLPLP